MRPAAARGTVGLARAMSKLGLASRSEAIALVLAGRVRVSGRIVCDPGHRVVPEIAALAIVAVSVLPIAVELLRHRRAARLDGAAPTSSPD